MLTPTAKEEAAFAAELRAMADTAKAEVNYNPTRFKQMLAEHGGFTTAHRLLERREPSDGFNNMLMAGRVDLTLECLIQRPQWARFFSQSELAFAKQITGGRC